MKKYLRLFLVIGFMAPTLAYATVAAQSSTGGTDSTTTSSGSSATTTNTQSSDDTKGLADRLAARKAALKTKLSAVQSDHLKNVCKSAQGKATSTDSKVKGLATSRTQVYANITSKLNDLVTKLQAKNVDVTQLKAEITSLQSQITTFNTDLATYKQDVSDLVAMDCASDPTAFQASLDTARAARDKVLQDSTAIKTYVDGTIKPTLQQIRAQLAKTEGDNTSSTTDNKDNTTSTTTTNSTTVQEKK